MPAGSKTNKSLAFTGSPVKWVLPFTNVNFIGQARFRVDGLAKDYEVLLSKRVMVEQNFPGHILTLSDRPIFTPEKESFWLAQHNLHWHRRNTFRK
jgi:hypothetical protein